MKKVKLSADLVTTEKASKLRKEKNIPAVIYGPNHKAVKLFVNELAFVKAYREVGKSTMFELDIKGDSLPVLVHAVQRNPVTEKFIHVDFYALDVNKPVHVTVPLRFEGDPAGVRIHGGVLVAEKDEIEVKCLPKNLISFLTVDISGLDEVGSAIHIKDLVVPEGIEIVDREDLNVIHIIASRVSTEEVSVTPVVSTEPTSATPAVDAKKAK